LVSINAPLIHWVFCLMISALWNVAPSLLVNSYYVWRKPHFLYYKFHVLFLSLLGCLGHIIIKLFAKFLSLCSCIRPNMHDSRLSYSGWN
jgi:hypothetical protein